MVAVDTNNIQDETSDGGGDGFNAFLDIVYSPTSKSNDDVDIEQRSETSTTNSHTAFIDYLKSPDKTPAPPPSPKKKAASSSVAATSNNLPTETVDDDIPTKKRSNCEAIGDKVDESISGFFYRIGHFCSYRPKTTIALSLAIAILCAGGMAKLNTENRPEKVSVLFILFHCIAVLFFYLTFAIFIFIY